MRGLLCFTGLLFTGILFTWILALAAPASAQSLDGSLNGALFGNLNGGIQSGFQSGLAASLGQGGRTAAILSSDTFNQDDNRDIFRRQDLERQGFALDVCAPGQITRNYSGCRPVREFMSRPPSAYDLSIQAMGPLRNLTLQGVTLDSGPGPAGPLD